MTCAQHHQAGQGQGWTGIQGLASPTTVNLWSREAGLGRKWRSGCFTRLPSHPGNTSCGSFGLEAGQPGMQTCLKQLESRFGYNKSQPVTIALYSTMTQWQLTQSTKIYGAPRSAQGPAS